MRFPRFRTMLLPFALAAAPVAAQNQRDMSNDCFDVAAPMADATPCYEPNAHTHPHGAHHDRNANKTAAKKAGMPSGATPRKLVK